MRPFFAILLLGAGLAGCGFHGYPLDLKKDDKVTVKADPKRQVWEVYWFEPLSEIYYLKRWDSEKNDFQIIHIDALTADKELENLEQKEKNNGKNERDG